MLPVRLGPRPLRAGPRRRADALRSRSRDQRRLVMATIPGYDRITVEPGKLGGKPCIRGMRISVSRVLDILATYKSREEIRLDFPDLEDQDFEQALRFA